MANPLNAETDPKTGIRYYYFNEHKLMSVTSLRRTVGMSFGLHNWAVGQTIDAALDLRAADLDDDEWKRQVRKRSTTKRDEAASLGTDVHEAAENGERSVAMKDGDPRKPFVKAYEDWMDDNEVDVLMQEAQVFHLGHRYAGSLDLIADLGGHRYVIDLKTGKGLYNDHAIQLAMYYMAEFVGGYDKLNDEDMRYEDLTKTFLGCDRAAVLHLRPGGYEFVEVPITQNLIDAATSMVTFAHWVDDNPTLAAYQEAAKTLQGVVRP